MAAEERQNIVDDDIRHRLAHLRRSAAEMRRQHDVGHFLQRLVDLGLVLEHVEAGAGDLLFGQRANEGGFIDDRVGAIKRTLSRTLACTTSRSV